MPGLWSLLTQLIASPGIRQRADHSETMYRCDGRLQEASDWNMWSWSTKFLA